MQKYILKIKCSDEKGLIYRVSDVIFKHRLNIETNNEFVDKENNRFFMRAELSGELNIGEFCGVLEAVLPSDAEISCLAKAKKDIIVLATKETHCLGDLLIKFDSGELNANIVAVVANHEILRSLVERFNIPFHVVSAEGMSREDHEDAVLEVMSQYKFDYAILAKYMRILTPKFVNAYPQKIINIHHSFLPAFIGANPYKQAYERGVKIIGATAHFVNDNLDEGPIITQDVIHVNHEMSWQDMQRAGRTCEKSVLSKALDLAFDDRLFINENKVIVF
ncbi:formyltetrahydrofolate deformylase [Campylobacter sp. RM9344]|uniref:Formyltetrahydrofolate deformylase n=1 Tax=Campylobacter californiensis TaxID=1032243 RepID=A0AAW3ZX50_9BACT|nr:MULTISPECIES: formyltetrahydrofolate deformylase [unclassified Campylobacter]MBE2985066.1 formyltetrahydrofolate deformylase [Campylobacter sp. RM6883]MBE2986599.1 formyltetrahydrofolate deformylase [Campylobacter sp. RM12919]MBE2987606.1 formyltetrahydrofolate deformylase [Campylobacter sp. RM12920]MBE2995609.1 formyltetrahydrofolate deformylase [Campylobacter sp. RM6913]MBE3022266.1 formyltetrahydrofolate deformylase [Campylobacter sp. 7477a]MBE3029229.1 formyltetrahydrofolate deformylas